MFQPMMNQVQPQPVVQCIQSPAQTPMGPNSTSTFCRTCNKQVYSKTSRKAKTSAWYACLFLFICGCSFGCCLIPCCMHSFNVVNHKCPECNAYLGQYRP